MNETTVTLLILCGALSVAVGFLYVRLRSAELRIERSETPVEVPDTPGDKNRTEAILDKMSEGVVLLDGSGRAILANKSAQKLLGLGEGGFGLRVTSDEVLSVAQLAQSELKEVERVVETWFPSRGHLHVRATPLEDQSGAVVIIADITEELRTQSIRREFVAHASHELKSPVASLHALAEAVHEAVRDDPEAAMRFSARLIDEATRLGRLIADLLDLSRLEDPSHVPNERVDLSAVGHREAQHAREAALGKDLGLTTNVTPDVIVQGDEQQLALMLRNLLDNAIRYTPEGGHVVLDIRNESGEAVIRVIDTGIGIPLAAQGRVFERFYRIDKARSRDKGGTGLGLAIVKHTVELHGGSVGVDSELEQGSTFTVKLPGAPTKQALESAAG